MTKPGATGRSPERMEISYSRRGAKTEQDEEPGLAWLFIIAASTSASALKSSYAAPPFVSFILSLLLSEALSLRSLALRGGNKL